MLVSLTCRHLQGGLKQQRIKRLLQIRRDFLHPYLLPQPAMHLCV